MAGVDPISLIPAGVQTAFGLGNIFFSGRKKAEKKLSKLIDNAPQYGGDSSISRYYSDALSRYNTNPSDSAMYKRNSNNIRRNLSTGLSSLGDRRSGLAGVSTLTQGADDSFLNTEVEAEQEKSRRFGEYGNATDMKSGDDWRKFQTNVIDPYQLRLDFQSKKAAAANDRYNSGWNNVSQGANNATAILSEQDSQDGGRGTNYDNNSPKNYNMRRQYNPTTKRWEWNI